MNNIFIPIKEHSERVPNKNFRLFGDKPLYQHTIDKLSDFNVFVDTDSIHLNYDDVPILEKEFIKKYNRVLTGKKLGQFHIDFNMKDKEGNDRQGKDEEIYATKSVFLAKKCYLDKLESRDEEGNIINDYHYRMKGITKEGILHQAKQYKNGIEGLYEDLAKGTKIEFNLMPYDKDNESQKVLFQYVNGRVNFKKEFTRKVQF